MTYPRLQYPGALFHVMTRGNERRRTFRTPQDYRHFLSLLGEAVDMFRWILYTYALMPAPTNMWYNTATGKDGDE